MAAEGGIPFGSYTLFRRLARGGMAEVFLARQRYLEGYDRRVAVKRILPHLSDSADFVRMFLGEARLAARLTHPNIVHIYDFGKVGDEYYIAMEYVDGVHAGQLIKHAKDERLPPTLVARVGADAAAALHYAHNFTDNDGKPLRLVHRDVSPPNLMVSYDGVVKLVDFGIAKATAVEQLTNPGTVKGKYAYMSPEQTTARTLDGRSDVFSLGLVLWEMVAGRHIIERGNPVDAMRAIRDGKLPRIDSVVSNVPRELSQALDLALETDREDRASALELSQILEAYIKAAPELATSMQVATWIRGRFQPAATGQVASIPDGGVGTRVATSGSSAAQAVITPQARGMVTENDGDLGDTTMIDGGTLVGARSTLSGEDEAVSSVEGPTRRKPANGGAAGGGGGAGAAARQRPGQSRPPPVPLAMGSRKPPTRPVTDDGASDLDFDETIARGPAVRPTPTPVAGGRSIVLVRPEDRPTEIDAEMRPMILPETVIAEPRPGGAGVDVRAGGAGGALVPAGLPGEPTVVAGPPTAPLGSTPPGAGGAAGRDPRTTVAAGTATNVPALPAADGSERGHRRERADRSDDSERADPTNLDQTGRASLIDRTANRFQKLAATPRRRALLAAIAGGICAALIGVVCVKLRGGDAAAIPDAAPAIALADAALPVDAVPVTTELRVVTNPPGAVAVVGDRRGQTPITFALAPGKFTVHIELADHLPVDRTVELALGDHRILDLGLDEVPKPIPVPDHPDYPDRPHDTVRKAPGGLTVRTTPYSDVYLGKNLLGQTPFADLPLPPGTHTLTFKHPGRRPISKTIEITSNKTTKLNFSLP